MNPTEKKIRELGGTIVSEPMRNADGTDNPKFPDALFTALEIDAKPKRPHKKEIETDE